MEWLVGTGTLALAVATVILAVQAYHARVDATQPAVALILDPPRDAPLKPPAFATEQPSPPEAGDLFTDRDSNTQLLLVQAPGAILNDGPRAATIEMLGAAGSTPWDKFELLDWVADVNDDIGDTFRKEVSFDSFGPVAPLGDLAKVTPHRLGPGRYLLPARSISRLQITLGATVAFWGTASASEPPGPPLPLRAVSRVLEVRPAGGGGAVDRIRFELRAAPVRRNPSGDGWVVGSPVEVRSESGITYVMPHPESLVAPPVRMYPFGVRRVLRALARLVPFKVRRVLRKLGTWIRSIAMSTSR